MHNSSSSLSTCIHASLKSGHPILGQYSGYNHSSIWYLEEGPTSSASHSHPGEFTHGGVTIGTSCHSWTSCWMQRSDLHSSKVILYIGENYIGQWLSNYQKLNYGPSKSTESEKRFVTWRRQTKDMVLARHDYLIQGADLLHQPPLKQLVQGPPGINPMLSIISNNITLVPSTSKSFTASFIRVLALILILCFLLWGLTSLSGSSKVGVIHQNWIRRRRRRGRDHCISSPDPMGSLGGHL